MSGTSSSPSSSSSSKMTIDIRPMIEDVSQVMTKHITNILSGVIGEYNIYKETHDTIMGLPCVRKLQERISELEDGTCATTQRDTVTSSREDEISQLQGAIVDLNRYIHALESKVDMKSVSRDITDEESVKLEIHEEDDENESEEDEDECAVDACVVSSTHKNVIITAAAVAAAISVPVDEEAEAEDEEAEDEAEEAAEEEEAEEEEAEEDEEDEEAEEAEEAEAEEADAEAEDEAEDEEAEEAEDEEAEEAEEADEAEDAEEAEEEAEADAEAEAEEAEDAEAEAEAEAEEAEIEVSEVKIKGKTYFTTDAVNGIIYACVDEDVGDEVGVFKNGVAVFNKSKK